MGMGDGDSRERGQKSDVSSGFFSRARILLFGEHGSEAAAKAGVAVMWCVDVWGLWVVGCGRGERGMENGRRARRVHNAKFLIRSVLQLVVPNWGLGELSGGC